LTPFSNELNVLKHKNCLCHSVCVCGKRLSKIESNRPGSFLKSISYKYGLLSTIITSLVIYMSSIPDRSYLGVSSATEQILFNFAHIPAFALLTLLWLKTFNFNGKGSFSHLFVLSGLALFAVSTEILQSFVPGRTASIMDFGLDLIGIFSGFLIFWLFRNVAL
jgi:VanZ family protein